MKYLDLEQGKKYIQDFHFNDHISLSGGNDFVIFWTKLQGKVYSFGQNSIGQLGVGHTKTQGIAEVKFENLNENEQIIQCEAGGMHVLALTNQGNVYAWGNNYYGQLGIKNDYKNLTKPKKIEPADFGWNRGQIISVACGYNHSLATTKNGNVYTWGCNEYGELGRHESMKKSWSPEQIDIDSVHMIGAGRNFSYVVNSDEELIMFGNNEMGQLGSDNSDSYNIVKLDFSEHEVISKISCGWGHTLLLTNRNRVFGWGKNNHKQINPTFGDSVLPTCLPSPIIVDIATGNFSSYLITNTRQIISIGMRIPFMFGKVVEKIIAGSDYTLIMDNKSNLTLVGLDAKKLGLDASVSLEQYKDKQLDRIIDVSASCNYYFAALTAKGDIFTWGENRNNVLGNPNIESNGVCTYPLKIKLPEPVETIFLNDEYHKYEVVTKYGNVYTWGDHRESFKEKKGDPKKNILKKQTKAKLKRLESWLDDYKKLQTVDECLYALEELSNLNDLAKEKFFTYICEPYYHDIPNSITVNLLYFFAHMHLFGYIDDDAVDHFINVFDKKDKILFKKIAGISNVSPTKSNDKQLEPENVPNDENEVQEQVQEKEIEPKQEKEKEPVKEKLPKMQKDEDKNLKNIQTLELKNRELTTQNLELTKEKDALTKEIQTLKMECHTLTTQSQLLSSDVANKNAELEILKTQNEHLTHENKQIPALKEEIIRLEKEYKQSSTKVQSKNENNTSHTKPATSETKPATSEKETSFISKDKTDIWYKLQDYSINADTHVICVNTQTQNVKEKDTVHSDKLTKLSGFSDKELLFVFKHILIYYLEKNPKKKKVIGFRYVDQEFQFIIKKVTKNHDILDIEWVNLGLSVDSYFKIDKENVDLNVVQAAIDDLSS